MANFMIGNLVFLRGLKLDNEHIVYALHVFWETLSYRNLQPDLKGMFSTRMNTIRDGLLALYTMKVMN